MADETKQRGLFSWLKKNRAEKTPSTDNGPKQQHAAPKPAPPPATAAAVPKAPEKSKAEPAPVAKPAMAEKPSAPPQAAVKKSVATREQTEPVDTVAAIRTYIESVSRLSVNHLNMTSTILNNFSEYITKRSGDQKQNQ